jgi:hypothetical protein
MLSALGCAEAVAVDVLKGALSRVGRSKVRAVAAEHCDPLGARLVDGVGDEVGGVVVATALSFEGFQGCGGGADPGLVTPRIFSGSEADRSSGITWILLRADHSTSVPVDGETEVRTSALMRTLCRRCPNGRRWAGVRGGPRARLGLAVWVRVR